MKNISNYTWKEYKSQPQNWAVTQDKRGIIYAANNGGILEFDGVSWKEILIPNKTVRSLAVGDNGTVFVGGINEIGFLEPDSKGTLKYESLINHLEEKYRNFSYVWRTHSTKKGIYFCTSKFLFLWDFEKIIVWETDGNFAAPFLCSGKLYTRQNGIGLLEMKGNSLELVPGGEEFASKPIYIMVPYDSKKLLIGTRSAGFYLYDGKKAVPFPTAVDFYLKENQLSHGIRLKISPGYFALATLSGGLVIIDSQGNCTHIFNTSCDLQDNSVKYVFEDLQGSLWLALNNGMAKVEYASPFSIYNEQANLPGFVLSVVRHHKDLYTGTSNGLYQLTPSGRFQPVPGISNSCWHLLSVDKTILSATDKGVFQIEKNVKKNIFKHKSFVLSRSQKDKNRIWVGSIDGLASLYFKENQWLEEYRFEDITQEIRTLAEDKKGNLWLGVRTKGVLGIDFLTDGTISSPLIRGFNSEQGLPDGEIHVFTAAGHVMFATGKGIFRFDETNRAFVPDYTLGKEFAGGENGRSVFRLVEDRKKNIWLHSNARNIQALRQPDGTFVINERPFFRIPLTKANTIYPEPGGDTVWFPSSDGLIRYDTKDKKNYEIPFRTLIRKVWVNGEPVFNGCKKKEGATRHVPVIEYKNRNLRFEFAAPFFEAESETRYQCLLEGYEKQWTTWSQETWKDYTNLVSGMNIFRVRARNVYGTISSEDVFRFRVLPPWGKTWWAFLLYAAAASIIVFLIVKWRSWKLVKEKQRLEKIVRERTEEIREKNQQLSEQAEKLQELDKVKSRFFANLSHEFRTPLTLIMGPLEHMLSAPRENEKEQKKNLRLMLRNSRRLLGLINQLLELSKFDSGKVNLQCARQNIVPFIKGIIASFETAASQKDLVLAFHAAVDEIAVYFDPAKLEEAVSNLLSNALKFTPAGGRVTVTVTKIPGRDDRFPGGAVEIAVRDTGPGIPADQLAHIFDRFVQAESTIEHHHKGSGIGLAIAREVVTLHRGTIDVKSRESQDGEPGGSEFVTRLPLGAEHLEPGEILEPTEESIRDKQPGKTPVFLMDDLEEEIEKEPGSEAEAGGKREIEEAVREKDIVLVVEDSSDMRSYIRDSLRPMYRVIEAVHGREGIQKAEEIIPDLIISDIMMPEVDGCELCRVLKNDRNTSHIPIILLTAKAAEDNILEGLQTGADDYITKPFNTRILLARIKNLIDLRRQLQETWNREMNLQPTKMAVSDVDKEFVKELIGVMDKNMSDPEFNVEQLGHKLYMSHASLYRKIHALTGESPTDFIRSYRLKRGAEMLKGEYGTVLEVAFEVGFSSTAYFTKCFKEKFHQLPSTYLASESP